MTPETMKLISDAVNYRDERDAALARERALREAAEILVGLREEDCLASWWAPEMNAAFDRLRASLALRAVGCPRGDPGCPCQAPMDPAALASAPGTIAGLTVEAHPDVLSALAKAVEEEEARAAGTGRGAPGAHVCGPDCAGEDHAAIEAQRP